MYSIVQECSADVIPSLPIFASGGEIVDVPEGQFWSFNTSEVYSTIIPLQPKPNTSAHRFVSQRISSSNREYSSTFLIGF
jgi:hypothetical protein